MCLFRSTSKASPSWSRVFLSSSSLVAIAEPILSNTFRFSLYCLLFPSNLNSSSDSFGFSCFERLAASRSFLIFFSFVLYCFCCSSNSFAQLRGSCVVCPCSRVESALLCLDRRDFSRLPGLALYGSRRLRTRTRTLCVFRHWVAISKILNRPN